MLRIHIGVKVELKYYIELYVMYRNGFIISECILRLEMYHIIQDVTHKHTQTHTHT